MALENINRETLDQIPNMELASEIYPYIADSPLARMGFDAKKATVLPDGLVSGNYQLLGQYIPPNQDVKRIDPLISKSFVNYSRNPLDSISAYSADGSSSRESLLATLAHESAHRGTELLPPEAFEEYGTESIFDEMRVRVNDYYHGSPRMKEMAKKYLKRKYDMTVEEAKKLTRYDKIQEAATNYLLDRNRPVRSAPKRYPPMGTDIRAYFK
mgnify:CR=1 FL=1